MSQEQYLNLGQEILQKSKITAIDIGGAAGLQPQWLKIIGNAKIVMYEPHDESYTDLVNIYRNSPFFSDFVFINRGLSGTGGKRTFYKTNCPTGSSILEPDLESIYVDKDDPYFFPVTATEIDTYTLEESLNEAGVAGVDAVKLDIQGAELEVLKSLDQHRLDNCLLIETEISVAGLYKNCTTFVGVEEYLKFNGFELFDLRCNRAGRVVKGSRPNQTYEEKYFGLKYFTPTISSRLYEVDALYFRHPSTLLQNRDAEAIRKLIYCYCVYNFFCEAIYVLEQAIIYQIFPQADADNIGQRVATWHAYTKQSLKEYDDLLEKRDHLVWTQYLWSKHPNS